MIRKRSEHDNNNEFLDNQSNVKQIFFFAFYIVFFIFIVILFRGINNGNNKQNTRFNSGYNYSFNLNDINRNNYYFIYKKAVNDIITIYEGERYNNTLEFTMSGEISNKYYVNDDIYYLKNPNTLEYVPTTNPMDFSILVDNVNLTKLFSSATYKSFVEYLDSKAKDYNYEISTSSMLRIFNNEEIDLDDNSNKIVAKVDENGRLYEIDMDMTNYFKYFDQSITSYKLSLSYSKFGTIEKLLIN